MTTVRVGGQLNSVKRVRGVSSLLPERRMKIVGLPAAVFRMRGSEHNLKEDT